MADGIEPPPLWELREGRLHREFEFADFAEAFAFMGRVATEAEEAGHHPDWCNSWNRVVIDLWSHDVDAVTARDLDLARRIDAVVDPAG